MLKRSICKTSAKIKPSDKNGPKGISDLIVRPLSCPSKPSRGSNFEIMIIETDTNAPIQNAKMTADSPSAGPIKKPITKIYFTSPNPSHLPLENKNKKPKGKHSAIAESTYINENPWKRCRARPNPSKATKKVSGIIKCRRS